jgi:hypothetical protein
MSHIKVSYAGVRSKLLMCVMLSASLSACLALPKTAQPIDPLARPTWVDNPGEGVSASAGTHIRGRVAQEALAVSRAREELAKRMGVTISSETVTEQRVQNERMTTKSATQMQESVSGKEVKASVKAKWLDPNSQMLWVWLVPSP